MFLEEREDTFWDEKIEQVRQFLLRAIRVGEVVEVNPLKHAARVRIPDLDGVITMELPVLIPAARKNRFYCLPDVGDRVVCLCLPYGQEQGFILGAYYPLRDDPPRHNEHKKVVEFEDGTSIEYDSGRGVLHIEHKTGTKIHISDDGEIDIKSVKAVKLTAPVIHLHGEVLSSMPACFCGRAPCSPGASPCDPQEPPDP